MWFVALEHICCCWAGLFNWQYQLLFSVWRGVADLSVALIQDSKSSIISIRIFPVKSRLALTTSTPLYNTFSFGNVPLYCPLHTLPCCPLFLFTLLHTKHWQCNCRCNFAQIGNFDVSFVRPGLSTLVLKLICEPNIIDVKNEQCRRIASSLFDLL